jgi:hypothetical protein
MQAAVDATVSAANGNCRLELRLTFTMADEERQRVRDEYERWYSSAAAPERAAQAELVRCIFGNPFRPVTPDPSWRTSTVVALAQQMYESRDFAAMPILADALQDAGCVDEAVLDHCRTDGPHVRGCWVVDLLLGKE